VQAFDPKFAVVEKTVTVIEAYLAIADRFYFRAGEYNACL